jgi:hypothetical protein
LMRVVDSAVAVMNTHRGAAAVAEHGVLFVCNLSFSPANVRALRGSRAQSVVTDLVALHPRAPMIAEWGPQFLARVEKDKGCSPS